MIRSSSLSLVKHKTFECEVLDYLTEGPGGRYEILPLRRPRTLNERRLAYLPGLGIACDAIARDPTLVNSITGRGNRVAVVSNATAVMGLGQLAPSCVIPVLENKVVQLKTEAGVNGCDLAINALDPEALARICMALEPSFSMFLLEDIAAPGCFELEEHLAASLSVPVMHMDQHGTAVAIVSRIICQLEQKQRSLAQAKIVIFGAGAAGIAAGNLLLDAGASSDQLFMFDSRGHIHAGRASLNVYKSRFANSPNEVSLREALSMADAFIGVSRGNTIEPNVFRAMARDCVILLLSNPLPECDPGAVHALRPDAVIGSGSGDGAIPVFGMQFIPAMVKALLDLRFKRIPADFYLNVARIGAARWRAQERDSQLNSYKPPASFLDGKKTEAQQLAAEIKNFYQAKEGSRRTTNGTK